MVLSGFAEAKGALPDGRMPGLFGAGRPGAGPLGWWAAVRTTSTSLPTVWVAPSPPTTVQTAGPEPEP